MHVLQTSLLALFAFFSSTIASPATNSKGDDAIYKTLTDRGYDKATLSDVRKGNANCANACKLLTTTHPANTIVREEVAEYGGFQALWWSRFQGEANPYCIFQPLNNIDVSSVVLVARVAKCPFAVKSGGHAAFRGASNVDGGITIDMKNINDIVPSADKTSVVLGTGNVWFNVYTTLEKQNISVVGGRDANVGVGGFTLGGGISFFSNQRGWAVDNVINYEVVDANGFILNANKGTNSDLFWALRGGGNNFGIVTRFTVKSFSQGPIWGGFLFFQDTLFPQLTNEFVKYVSAADKYPGISFFEVLSYLEGNWQVLAYPQNRDPLPPLTYPPAFQSLAALPHVVDTTANKLLSAATIEVAGGPELKGYRHTWWSASFAVDAGLMQTIGNICKSRSQPVIDKNIPGLFINCAFQAITRGTLKKMANDGGNPLGLDPNGDPILFLNFSGRWLNPADDAIMIGLMRTITVDSVKAAQARGMYKPYIYMNYASQFEPVIASYGAKNHNRLKDISKKYDPLGVFQKLQPGYFKL